MEQKKVYFKTNFKNNFNNKNKEIVKETKEDKIKRWENIEMKFGKYKGKKLIDIKNEDPDYLLYLSNNFEDLNKGLKKIIDSLLN